MGLQDTYERFSSFVFLLILIFFMITIEGLFWIVSYTKRLPEYFSRYETRSLILLMILSSFLFWECIGYYYVLDGKRLKVSLDSLMVLFAVVLIISIFDTGRGIYIPLLLGILFLIYKTKTKELILFLPALILDFEQMSVYLILLTFYLIQRGFFMEKLHRKEPKIFFFIIATLLILFKILSIAKVIIAIALLAHIVKYLSKTRIFHRKLLAMSILATLLALIPAGSPKDIHRAMFHVTITCSYAILFVIYIIILGRRGWIILPSGYSRYLEFVYLGIGLLLLYQLSLLFEGLHTILFSLMGIYGILFSIISYRIYCRTKPTENSS